MTVSTLATKLERERVTAYELIRHRHTETAAGEADATGTPRAEVGKTLVLVGGHGFVRVVIPACARLDLHKVRPLIGCGPAVRMASEAELAAAYPMFELGAVPPFGGPGGDVTIVDRRLALLDHVLVEAGSHDESLRIATPDLIRIADAQIADVSTPL